MPATQFPPFQQHPLLRGGHAQTLSGVYLPWPYAPYTARQHVVDLDDGDRLVLHDDPPQDGRPARGTCLVVHGLGGSHRSGYMRRVAAKLTAGGVCVFRMDLRGCGAGRYLAIRPAHCGRWADAAAALQFIARQQPGSPVVLVGFSLGGAIALNLAAELGSGACGNLVAVMAACPPIDLHAVRRHFTTPTGRLYDREFVRLLWPRLVRRQQQRPDMPRIDVSCPPRRLYAFDELVTAPQSGFASADDYYTQASTGPRLRDIRTPTLIVASEDDPIVPTEPLLRFPRSDAVDVVTTHHGGHLGYVGRAGCDPDRRWLDWRVVEWVHRNIAAATPTGIVPPPHRRETHQRPARSTQLRHER